MVPAHPRLRRLVVGLVGIGLVLLILSYAARIAVSVERIFGRHAGVAMTQDQIILAHEDASRSPGPPRARPVPRIIHQIFHNWKAPGNDSLPADWAELRRSCLVLHPTWEHKVRFGSCPPRARTVC